MWVNDDKTFTFGWTDKLVLQIVYFFCVGNMYSPVSFLLCLKEEDTAAGGGSEKPGGSDDSGDDEDDSDEDSDEDSDDDDDDEGGEEGENEEPLSLEWPDTRPKQATYLFLLPILFPLWLTVPDVRNPVRNKTSHYHCFFLNICIPYLQNLIELTLYIVLTGIQEVLCHHLPWLNSMDCYIFLSYGVVGTPGQCRKQYLWHLSHT